MEFLDKEQKLPSWLIVSRTQAAQAAWAWGARHKSEKEATTWQRHQQM